MQEIKTALGRWIPYNERQTLIEDKILRVLYDYRMNPQNPNNVPMKISDIVRAVTFDQNLVLAAVDSLKEVVPPFIEEKAIYQQERTFSISGSGVRFVRNLPDE